MPDRLEQVLKAAERKDWSLANQWWQQLEDASSWELVFNLALESLVTGDFQERWEVAKVWPKFGSRAIAPLINILENEAAELELRWFAARILGEFREEPEVAIALAKLLQAGTDEELAAMAAEALSHQGINAIAPLQELLAADETRLLAARALAGLGLPPAIDLLLKVAEDTQPAVRVAAIEALGSCRDRRVEPVLLAALGDLSAPIRKEAAAALGIRAASYSAAEDLAAKLQPLLQDLNIEVAAAAAIALGKLATPAAVKALFAALQSPYSPLPLQLDIVRALGWMEAAAGIEHLQMALGEAAAPVRQEIIAVLGRVENPDLKPIAAQIVADFARVAGNSISPSCKCGIALALGQLQANSTLPVLIDLLADANLSVQLHAIAALKRFPDASQLLGEMGR